MFAKSLCGYAFVFGMLCAMMGCQTRSTETSVNMEPSGPSTSVTGGEPSEEQKSKLLSAKDALFAKLSRRLMEVISASGPVGAIEVCKEEAVKFAIEVGKDRGVRVGRTGVRLRNPNNQPPTWAEPFINKKVDEPVFALLSDDRAAALLPIKLQTQCLMCHGPSEAISPDIQETLGKLYPQDQAIGFLENELRGWFWVESLGDQ